MTDRASATDELHALLDRAREQARVSGQRVLVSVVERASSLDPVAVLQALADAARDDAGLAELLRAGRMLWSSPRGELSLAAVGAAAELSPAGPGRFTDSDAEWRALLDGAVVAQREVTPGLPVGPILMGGFSFDPHGPRSPEWSGFTSTHLIAPAAHLTRATNGCWLTLTTVVTPDGETTVNIGLLSRLRTIMLAQSTRTSEHQVHHSGAVPAAGHDDASANDFRALVRDAVTEIRDGRMDKVVLARAVHATQPASLDVIRVLQHLRGVHLDAYVFAIWRGDRVFLGASPERLVRVRDDVVDVSSLAGSARRGATEHEDDALANGLLDSAKDREEHVMVRESLEEILATLCDDVTFPEEPALLTLPHVHHLHTPLRARLRAGSSLLQLAGALHPTPAVGGSPREAALRFIRERERLDRGWYAAPVGWVGRDDGELAVALRSALVHGTNATLFAGCGIVAGSEPDRELAESEAKLGAMRAGLAAGQA